MYVAHRWKDRNLTKLELVTSLLLISLLIFYMSQRASVIFATVEKNNIEYTITNINTALRLKSFSYLTRNDMKSILDIKTTNPMQLMDNESSEDLIKFYEDYEETGDLIKQLYSVNPGNYRGEVYASDVNELEKGFWYFNLSIKKLVYIIKNDEFINIDLDGPSRLIFSVNINYNDNNKNNIYDYKIDEFYGIKLKSDYSYEWQI